MIRNQAVALSLVCLVVLFVGCVAKEPEGPGEQIGKGIDLITKGLGEIDQQNLNESKLEREQREKEERRRRENYDDKNTDLGHDPYYDSPPRSGSDSYYGDDLNSERRY